MVEAEAPNAVAALVVWVMVLGDFGRSPRMQYHTLSLSQQPGVQVYVLANTATQPLRQLTATPNVHMVALPETAAWLRKLPRVLALGLKVLQQLTRLLWLMLVVLPRPHRILLQNPPAIPTMALCWLAAKRHGARLVIDWHNYGYSIMALGMRPGHWLVKLARQQERFWGRQGHAHFTVTKAMQHDLQDNWGIPATVLYDRPPSFFGRTPLPATHQLLQRLQPSLHDPTFHDWLTDWLAQQTPQQHPPLGLTHSDSNTVQGDTLLTTAGPDTGSVCARPDRPALVVSSTSWTADEDFRILLEAAQLYDTAATAVTDSPSHTPMLPRVLFIITGRGPQRDQYLQQLRGMVFKRVAFRSVWLEASDYPLLLGTADVGVCLHASSSGLDLPMKVVDMFGSGVPVCALAYSCISELVAHGSTGLLFASPEQLSEQLQQLLSGLPQQPGELLRTLQAGVRAKQQGLRWDANWQDVAWPVIRGSA